MSSQLQPRTGPPQETNGLAVAGFVISLVGVLAGGMLSPIGLILSLVALGRPGGRGFAVAGIVIGLIGSCGLIFLVLLFILGVGMALMAVFLGVGYVLAQNPEQVEFTMESALIGAAIEAERDRAGDLPPDLGVLSLDQQTLTDPWGNAYRYVLADEKPGFDIVSSGPDGVPDTDDDLALSRLDELWQGLGGVEIVRAEGDGEHVEFRFGDKRVTISEREGGGGLTIDTGDRVIEIDDDSDGAAIRSRESREAGSDEEAGKGGDDESGTTGSGEGDAGGSTGG